MKMAVVMTLYSGLTRALAQMDLQLCISREQRRERSQYNIKYACFTDNSCRQREEKLTRRRND